LKAGYLTQVEGDRPDTTRPAFIFEKDQVEEWAKKNDIEL
jgi:hypothetical protein